MKLKRFDDIDQFLKLTKPVLVENEAENNLILGIALYIQKDPNYFKDFYLVVILDDDKISAISICTPPYKLLFWFKNENCEEEIQLLVDDVIETELKTSGVLGSSQHALQLAEYWRNKTGRTYRSGMSERIYKLENITFPTHSSGSMRLATLDDLKLICKWMEEFHIEAVPDDPLDEFTDFATKKINNQDLVIWNDVIPICLASRARPTINGICINLVYTPKEFRKQGYASTLVAHLCQKLLDDGWKFIILFTDLSNPTSNSLYLKVGFKPVCDFQEYFFNAEF